MSGTEPERLGRSPTELPGRQTLPVTTTDEQVSVEVSRDLDRTPADLGDIAPPPARSSYRVLGPGLLTSGEFG